MDRVLQVLRWWLDDIKNERVLAKVRELIATIEDEIAAGAVK